MELLVSPNSDIENSSRISLWFGIRLMMEKFLPLAYNHIDSDRVEFENNMGHLFVTLQTFRTVSKLYYTFTTPVPNLNLTETVT